MAVQPVTKTNGTGDSVIFTWVLGSGDTGEPVSLSDYSDRTVTMTGNFNSAAVALQGSNDKLTWMTQKDASDNTISKSSDDIELVGTNPTWTRPSASTVTSVTVIINAVRGK